MSIASPKTPVERLAAKALCCGWDAAIVEAADIADTEAAEYQKQIDEHNQSPRKDVVEGARLHGRRDAAANIAALIRQLTESD